MAIRKLTHDEISLRRLRPEEVHGRERTPVIGILDSIRSLYNVGSIFRTADGAFLAGLYLCGYTPSPPRKEIEKTALGTTGTVPWKHFRDPADAVREAREAGYRICVLEHTSESMPIHRIGRGDFPVALVVGNEVTGVSPALVAAADMAADIPMYGTKQSLNAAVAFGVAAFELARIWREG